MDFTGRYNLIVTYDDNIAKLKKDFIDECVKFYGDTAENADNEQAKSVFANIFESLLLREPDAKALYDKFESLLKEKKDRENLLNSVLLSLIFKFNAIENSQYTSYFINALDRIKGILTTKLEDDEKTEEAPHLSANSLFFENPIDTFKRIKYAKKDVEFLNLYDGVNIRSGAKILAIDDEQITFGMDVMQILAMKQEGHGFIVPNDYFAKHIKGDIIDFSIAEKYVTLTNFSRISNLNANLRTTQRVYPNRFTRVYLSNGQASVDGNLYDISDGGLSVLVTEFASFKQGDEIDANFELLVPQTEATQPTKLKAKLVTELAYKGHIRYCLQTIGGEGTGVVQKFTAARVKETMEELRTRISLYQ